MLRTMCSLLLLCWALLGCTPQIIDDSPKLAAGMEDTSDDSLRDVSEKLGAENVQVITIGDEYMISIPAAILFYNQSPKMRWSSYQLLDDVVAYLQGYRKLAVKVNAYSEYCQSVARTQVLTETRAKVLGKYLWSQDIGVGMVFTAGFGNNKPITAARESCSDSSPNARVEILFKEVAG